MSKSHKELSENNSTETEDLNRIENAASNNSLEKETEEVSSEKLPNSEKRATLRKKSKLREKRPKLNEILLTCSYCDQEFEFPSVLKIHIRSHTNERLYVCKICNKSFKQLGHLSQHSITHTDYRSLQCSQCGVKFESLYALKIHSQIYPGESNPKMHPNLSTTRLFECNIFQKVFTTKSLLETYFHPNT